MFFLTPYFDLYEEIVDGKKEEEQIKKAVAKMKKVIKQKEETSINNDKIFTSFRI